MEAGINLKLLSDPANRGKHLICVAGKVFKARNAREARKILDRIELKYPKQKVTLAYVPKSDTLILFL